MKRSPGARPLCDLLRDCPTLSCSEWNGYRSNGKLEKEDLGTINHDLKCFFKSIPILVSVERLQVYGMKLIEYSQSFCTKDESLSNNQWEIMIHHALNQRELLRYFPN